MIDRRFLSMAIPLAVLLFALLLFSILYTPQGEPVRAYFLTTGNFRYIAAQATVVAVGALGMTLVMAAGGIDLSVGAAIALAGVVTGNLLGGGYGPGVALLGAVGVGVMIGAINGSLISLLRVAPFMVTLAMAGAITGVTQWLGQKQGELPRTWINGLLAPFPEEALFFLSPGLWMAILLTALLAVVLRNSVFGCHLFAVGSNASVAKLCGVRVTLTRILAYALAGGLFGFAGVLHAGRVQAAAVAGLAESFSTSGLAIDIIAAALLGGATLKGGTGSVIGAVFAALIITTLRNGSQQAGWPPYTQEILAGAILILAVAMSRYRRIPAAVEAG